MLIKPDSARVFFRPFIPGSETRMRRIFNQVLALSDDEVTEELRGVLEEFGHRHKKIEHYLLNRYAQIHQELNIQEELGIQRRLLIGACFVQEYSMESAALFNPSIVPHPDQEGMPEGSLRFVMSLRATGEGHISSIIFRSGAVSAEGEVVIDKGSRYVTSAPIKHNETYDKAYFTRKMYELGINCAFSDNVMSMLDNQFDFNGLTNAIDAIRQLPFVEDNPSVMSDMIALARNNYELEYTPEQSLSERIIFPHGPNEVNGIEDARFVKFMREDGSSTYYATYTAYNGRTIYPQLLETPDFLNFRISTMNGSEASNKGMALFPRKINGRYAMISRQDGENVYIMFSDRIYSWHNKQLLLKPKYPWEFIQLGNCGSPLETEQGWLVLSHGVGPMRKYSIGAFLLDKDDPTRVLARTKEPILAPDSAEREGYVPNVVYSCGALIHQGMLVLPYAMSDYASSVAIIDMAELMAALKED